MNEENYNDTDWGGPCGAEPGCADGCGCDDILSCIPMPGACCTFLRKLRAPAIRLSYRLDKQVIPDMDKYKASCGCGEMPDGDQSGQPDQQTGSDEENCTCGCKDGTMTMEGSLTVRLFDLAAAGAAMMLLCCMTSCCKKMCKKIF